MGRTCASLAPFPGHLEEHAESKWPNLKIQPGPSALPKRANSVIDDPSFPDSVSHGRYLLRGCPLSLPLTCLRVSCPALSLPELERLCCGISPLKIHISLLVCFSFVIFKSVAVDCLRAFHSSSIAGPFTRLGSYLPPPATVPPQLQRANQE